jgi:hypothetical protein
MDQLVCLNQASLPVSACMSGLVWICLPGPTFLAGPTYLSVPACLSAVNLSTYNCLHKSSVWTYLNHMAV